MWGMHDGMGWWMVLGSFWVVVFWAGLLWFATSLIGKETTGQTREESPLEIAKRRYARGELSREQFEQIRQDLTG